MNNYIFNALYAINYKNVELEVNNKNEKNNIKNNIIKQRKILTPNNNKTKKEKIINKIGEFIKECRKESNKRKNIMNESGKINIKNKKQKIETKENKIKKQIIIIKQKLKNKKQ